MAARRARPAAGSRLGAPGDRAAGPRGRGLPEVRPGDDLGRLLIAALGRRRTCGDGDVVVVTSKIVSKAEGRARHGATARTRSTAETVRVVARRGPLRIVRTRHGLVLAAAGVDASNVEPGTVVLLPLDPDASARAVAGRAGRALGAAWRWS